MKTGETAQKEKKKFRVSLASLAELCFLLALGTGIGLSLRYFWGWDPYIQTGLWDILIYTSIGVALLLVYSAHIALRRLRKKRDETGKTRPDEKGPSEKAKNPLLSFIYFCVGSALTTYVIGLLLGYDSIDMFGLWEIVIYVVIGAGVLLACIATRKPHKRTSLTSPEEEGRRIGSS
jgi:hypothetical protein